MSSDRTHHQGCFRQKLKRECSKNILLSPNARKVKCFQNILNQPRFGCDFSQQRPCYPTIQSTPQQQLQEKRQTTNVFLRQDIGIPKQQKSIHSPRQIASHCKKRSFKFDYKSNDHHSWFDELKAPPLKRQRNDAITRNPNYNHDTRPMQQLHCKKQSHTQRL